MHWSLTARLGVEEAIGWLYEQWNEDMSKGKQATLFQSWGSNAKKKTITSASASTSNKVEEVIDLSDIDDEDDELLACVRIL